MPGVWSQVQGETAIAPILTCSLWAPQTRSWEPPTHIFDRSPMIRIVSESAQIAGDQIDKPSMAYGKSTRQERRAKRMTARIKSAANGGPRAAGINTTGELLCGRSSIVTAASRLNASNF